MMVETQQALDAKAMGVFTYLLRNKSKSIKAKTARDIFDLW
jgi:two-component SAPR family response regulator